MSYGSDILEQYRRAADNVDRILLATWLAADEGHEAGALIVTPMFCGVCGHWGPCVYGSPRAVGASCSCRGQQRRTVGRSV